MCRFPVGEIDNADITRLQFAQHRHKHSEFMLDLFIRTENGRSYVFVENSEGMLERRDIVTGGSLWGSYTEVLSGLTEDDHVAFPYGRSVKPGARANEASIEALYNY